MAKTIVQKMISITTDKKILHLAGGETYANKHAGKTYWAEIEEDDWAVVMQVQASFPANAYKRL